MINNHTRLILTAGSAALINAMIAMMIDDDHLLAVTLMVRGSGDGSAHNIFFFKAEVDREGNLRRVS